MNTSSEDSLDEYFTQYKSTNELVLDFYENSNQSYNSEFCIHEPTIPQTKLKIPHHILAILLQIYNII